MKHLIFPGNRGLLIAMLLLAPVKASFTIAQPGKVTLPQFSYTISFADPSRGGFEVELSCTGLPADTVTLMMPVWTPGYYQIMNFPAAVSDFTAEGKKGNPLAVTRPGTNSWQFVPGSNTPFRVSYSVKTTRKFVATSFTDSAHAYIIPGSAFLYHPKLLNQPVRVTVALPPSWKHIATGLRREPGAGNTFTAADFEILYDSPILAGNLEELPPFIVNGITHRFIAYRPGEFDRETFMANLKLIVEASVGVIGHIPYDEYTFIGIGPGNGGIEHLNNTTVSFDGSRLDRRESMNSMMGFLAHEYFHHYNVKRIRPFELGPFDYSRPNRTNLLWVAEGLTSYYDHLIPRRAGLITEHEMLDKFAANITSVENNPGRLHQSLIQSSYSTWSDGPFGRSGPEAGKTISYYEKGPLAGLILDLAIMNATGASRSLDDVMRLLYHDYYLGRQRGFTDAEFRQACETVAGTSLAAEFEYINTTREIDYNKYLSYAGLSLAETVNPERNTRVFALSMDENITPQQAAIRNKWMRVTR